jgi:hypothetical protein
MMSIVTELDLPALDYDYPTFAARASRLIAVAASR